MNTNKTVKETLNMNLVTEIKKNKKMTFVILLFIFAMICTINTTTTWLEFDSANSVSQNTTTGPETLEGRVSKLTTNPSTMRVKFNYISKNSNPTKIEEAEQVTIETDLSDFLNSNSLYLDTGNRTSKIFQEIFSVVPQMNRVEVIYFGETVDAYGNKKMSPILTYSITRDLYSKINWENFRTAKICDFLKSEALSNNKGVYCFASAKID